jgi:hypothetical protein
LPDKHNVGPFEITAFIPQCGQCPRAASRRDKEIFRLWREVRLPIHGFGSRDDFPSFWHQTEYARFDLGRKSENGRVLIGWPATGTMT